MAESNGSDKAPGAVQAASSALRSLLAYSKAAKLAALSGGFHKFLIASVTSAACTSALKALSTAGSSAGADPAGRQQQSALPAALASSVFGAASV
eukprot:scaffold120146_cov23-Prasinocladus_malaysianus.AAC.1